MSYTIYKSNGSDFITVPDQLISTEFYIGNLPAGPGNIGKGLLLIGRESANFGASLDQNFLQITENFASPTGTQPPDSIALQGQLWYDTSLDKLYVRRNNNNTGNMTNWAELATALTSGVSSFNTRTGIVSLNSTDVTTALGFTPISSAVTDFNARTGSITLLSSDVNNALGYIPLSDAVLTFNTRSGDILLNSTDVTTALGFTPTSNVGTVQSVTINGAAGNIASSGSPITTSGIITLDLVNTSVTPGTYTNPVLTIDNKGRITSATGSLSISDYVSVKFFGAQGDGSTDDSSAIQECFDFCTMHGGTAYFPSGVYIVSTPLTIDTGTSWAHFGPRANIRGAGAANTMIRNLTMGSSSALLTIGGFGAQYHIDICDISFQGTGTMGSSTGPDAPIDGYGVGTGLMIPQSSDMSIRNCVISGFGQGIHIENSFLITFNNTYVTSNLDGIYMVIGASPNNYSSPNAISFYGCAIGGNQNYGLWAELGITITMVGGSMEGNGISGTGPFVGALYVSGGTDGAANVSLSGVYFEQNAGLADIYLDNANNSGASVIQGCTFNRITSDHFTTHNILASAGTDIFNRIAIMGCGFSGFNSYSPDSSRTYIDTNGGDVEYSWAGCYFQNIIEIPTVDNYITIPNIPAASLITIPIIASNTTLLLPPVANIIYISGTTTIDDIAAGYAGRQITMVFQSSLSVTSGTLKLASTLNTSINTTLSLIYTGTEWIEVSRSIN